MPLATMKKPSRLLHGFTDRLISKRVDAGLTQQQIADKMGQHVTAISHWETGERTPSLQNTARLCLVLRCTISWLVFGGRE